MSKKWEIAKHFLGESAESALLKFHSMFNIYGLCPHLLHVPLMSSRWQSRLYIFSPFIVHPYDRNIL